MLPFSACGIEMKNFKIGRGMSIFGENFDLIFFERLKINYSLIGQSFGIKYQSYFKILKKGIVMERFSP